VATTGSDVYAPYLPRLVREWDAVAKRSHLRALEGSLVSVDISGFTALSERLASKGKLGAEELILTISRCYADLIAITLARGGDVLKFRGDALLLFFGDDGHEARACRAAVEMQELIGEVGRATSSVGPVDLGMYVGINSGRCHFFLVGAAHRELVVAGPAATETLRLEDLARQGEVLLSLRTAEALPPGSVGAQRDGARLLLLDAELPDPPLPIWMGDDADDLASLVPVPLRATLASGSVEAEHRNATAAFVKFTGTDALVADEREATEQIAALGTVVGQAVDEFGVTWLESDIDYDGGKIYLVAGAPSSAGGDEERMLRATRAIVDAGVGPAIAVGVNRGPVFAGEIGSDARRTYAVMGDTVNTAARLVARSKPGRILASSEVLKRSRRRFDVDPEPFLVKGKERAINAYWVGAPREEAEEGSESLPLVGRDAEVALLRAAIDDARRRVPRLVELVGPPGIGKSRLVEELRRQALGFQQLEAHAEEYESATPFFAFRSLLRPLAGITPEMHATEAGDLLVPWVQAVMPDLAPWLPLLAIPFDAAVPPTEETDEIDPGFRQRRLHEVVDQFLTRMLLMPTLFVFEDLHWMDDASRFLLRHLVSQPTPRPWLVCATRRPEGEALTGEPIELAPLAAEAAAQLALSAAGDLPLSPVALEHLAERSGGNPLFVRELVVAGGDVDDLPETVETVITSRIDRLDPVDRALLRCAAVIGSSFDLDLLSEVLSSDVAEAADLSRWEQLDEFLAWEGGGQLRFRHDLFRSVSYQGLSYRRRRHVHARVGEALERRAGEAGEEAAEILSLHFLEASEFDKAWGYSVVAADRAREKFANVDAAGLYERALLAAAQLTPDPAEISRVSEALGDVCELAARWEQAAAAYENAARLVPDDALVSTRLMRKQGVLHERRGAYETALGWYTGGLWELSRRDLGSAGLSNRAELELAAAGVRHRQGRFDDVVRLSRRAVRHAEQSGNRKALAHAYYLLDIAHTRLGRPDPSFRQRALPIYEELENLIGKSRLLNNAANEAHLSGRWDEALAAYGESHDLGRRGGDVVHVATIDNNKGEVLADQGRYAEAEALFTDALRVWRAARYPIGVAVATCNLGRVAARLRRFDEAHRLLDDAVTQLEQLGSESLALQARALIAECLVLEGRHAEARELTARLLERAPRESIVSVQLERSLGYALHQARRPEEARPHFDQSVCLGRELELEYEVGLSMRALADTGAPEYAGLADVIFERLGVIATPQVPLP
jgi:class 3 adenylate cyclase/tetratricopeptide (TPR) repeat protein